MRAFQSATAERFGTRCAATERDEILSNTARYWARNSFIINTRLMVKNTL